MLLTPTNTLNKAFLKVKPNRIEFNRFKANLTLLLDSICQKESEEFHKNLIIHFLRKTYYDPHYFINTKGHNDLVIHNGQNKDTSVGIILEVKKPANKIEMVSTHKLNVKAFQELILYYLRERITHKNLEIKYLIITNIYEWFIFDATLFERLFYENKSFIKQFSDFEGKRLASSKTDFFYKEIAEPFIDSLSNTLSFTYFDLRDYQEVLRNPDKNDDTSLIALFKLFSPEHFLKLPFANDSNTLNKQFYSELLHLIGLTETREKNKKLIQRNQPGERHTGTLLEDTILQLESLDKLRRLEKVDQFGTTQEEQLFQLALALSLTWINRLLFLKLLESQLIAYHKGDMSYSFLNINTIKNFNELNRLFFQVLAQKYNERNNEVKQAFEKVPYLNSSLFEPTELEQVTLFISNLTCKTIPLFSQTVLKDTQGKKRTGALNTLEYLFEFLNAYDFGSEGAEKIQEDNKILINASVLGLIFEKINGYQDGSFFTPGFITMYMCRETIRRAVVQKFNEVKGWSCTTFHELYDKIEDRHEANDIVNRITICDPAVGSGHFLVSALNEMIAVKNDLKILQDRQGKRLKEYQVEVVNDELIVTDEEGKLLDYRPLHKESQRVQETLFHEKKTIIENCLFGVDINPNSVNICRLRLWIELLKNAYYKNATELETLPNIDINIQCGNSLVSRYPVNVHLKEILKKSKWTMEEYQNAIKTYQNATSKEEKREVERLISDIQSHFSVELFISHPKVKTHQKKIEELEQMLYQGQLFERSKKEKAEWDKKLHQLGEEIQKLTSDIEEIKSGKVYENALEWRFAFPEVLNQEGDFIGFDVVIGNPPYIQLQSVKDTSEQLQAFHYNTYEKTGDLYSLFYEKGNNILKEKGYLGYITSNKWMRAGYGKTTRNYFLEYTQPELLIDLGSGVFEEATVDSNILLFKKERSHRPFSAVDVSKEKNITDLDRYSDKVLSMNPKCNESWIILSQLEQSIKEKIEQIGRPLKEWDIHINYGIKTGYNEAFIISGKKREELIARDPKSAEIIKPILRGRDIKRYKAEFANLWLIHTHNGLKEKNIPRIDVVKEYPAIYEHLQQYEEQLVKRQDQGDHWTNLRSCAYHQEFEKEKIVWKRVGSVIRFQHDNKKSLCLDSTCFLTGKNIYFLLAFLNSSIAIKQLLTNSPKTGTGDVIISVQALEPILIPPLSESEQQPFVALVEQICVKKEVGEDTADLEKQIDRLVYQLYDLTEEEIKIIEGISSIK